MGMRPPSATAPGAPARRSGIAGGLSFLFIIQLAGCQGGADGEGLLAEPPAGEVKFSSYSPAAPFSQQAPGILTRRAFVASSGTGYRVEVQDMLIGPRQKPAGITLAGPAVVEVRGGNAVMADGDRKQELKAGSTFSLAEGKALLIDNQADAPVTLRVHVFAAE